QWFDMGVRRTSQFLPRPYRDLVPTFGGAVKRLDTLRNDQRIGTSRSRSTIKIIGGHPRSGQNPDIAALHRSDGSHLQPILPSEVRPLPPLSEVSPDVRHPSDYPVIIPGSMGAASYLLAGEGNEAALCSVCHSAGRSLSRGKPRCDEMPPRARSAR